jgi:hypothetical protein
MSIAAVSGQSMAIASQASQGSSAYSQQMAPQAPGAQTTEASGTAVSNMDVGGSQLGELLNQLSNSIMQSDQLSGSGSNNPLLDKDTGGLVPDQSLAMNGPGGTSTQGVGQQGNEILAKAFDKSITLAAATLVVSGVSDTMRQLIRQQ